MYFMNLSNLRLEPRRPAIVINSNFDLPMRKIVEEGTDMNGFILRDCEVIAKSFFVQNIRYGGNMCDRQQESLGKYACYQMPNRSGNVVILVEMEFLLPDGALFTTFFLQ